MSVVPADGVRALAVRTPEEIQADVCKCWLDEEIREQRMKPYILHSAGMDDVQGIYDLFAQRCEEHPPGSDFEVYGALSQWLKEHRKGPKPNPFTYDYYSFEAQVVLEIASGKRPLADGESDKQGTSSSARVLDYGCGSGAMLSVLRRQGMPAKNLHCIELYDYVPKERREDFQLHVLRDPKGDLRELAEGSLHEYFDIIASFSVFHHIPDLQVRDGVYAGIAAMAKPGSLFLLVDWNSAGSPAVPLWYDVAHWLLWIMMGTNPPQRGASLSLATRYDSYDGYAQAAADVGLVPARELSRISPPGSSPLGTMEAVFRRTAVRFAMKGLYRNASSIGRRALSVRAGTPGGRVEPRMAEFRPEPPWAWA